MFGWATRRANILRGTRISLQKKLEGIRLMNELADKVLTNRKKIMRRKLRESSGLKEKKGELMHKKAVLNLILLLLAGLVFTIAYCLAEEESFTITTYYPSPYGSYNELRTNKMVIGDVNTASTPAPSQGAVTFSPAS